MEQKAMRATAECMEYRNRLDGAGQRKADSGRFECYKEQIRVWRKAGWSWPEVATARRNEEAYLQRKLAGWHEDGRPEIRPEEWRQLVDRCRRESGEQTREQGKECAPMEMPSRLDFLRCLDDAPTKVRNLLAKLKADSAEKALRVTPEEAMKVAGYGQKTVNRLFVWLRKCEAQGWRMENDGRRPALSWAACGSFEEWLDLTVREASMPDSPGAEERFVHKFRVFKQRSGLDREDSPMPTLEEVGHAHGLTRERVRQIEHEYLAGKKSGFQGMRANSWRFREFLGIVDEVFGGEYVLRLEEFLRRISGKLPWAEECGLRASRLLAILEWPVGDREVEGFVSRGFAEHGKRRYRTFLAVATGLERGDTDIESINAGMEARGMAGLSETEYAYFRGMAMAGSDEMARKLRDLTRTEINSRAFIEILEPVGRAGLSFEELQQRLNEKLGDNAPSLTGYLGRDRGFGPNGQGPYLWIPQEGGGNGRNSRYALSSCWEPLSPEKARELETRMAEHLRQHGCTAGNIRQFWKQWHANGTIPEEVCSPRVLLELLKQANAGIVKYPACHKAPVYALPEAEVPNIEVLKDQACRFFQGRKVVPFGEVLDFARKVFGYIGGQALYNECRRLFPTQEGLWMPDGTGMAPSVA